LAINTGRLSSAKRGEVSTTTKALQGKLSEGEGNCTTRGKQEITPEVAGGGQGTKSRGELSTWGIPGVISYQPLFSVRGKTPSTSEEIISEKPHPLLE